MTATGTLAAILATASFAFVAAVIRHGLSLRQALAFGACPKLKTEYL
jgi:hypothetical protein